MPWLSISVHVSSEGQENNLLVAIRADMSEEDLPALRSSRAVRSDQAFLQEYRTMLVSVIPVVGRDLQIAAGREAAVWIGTDIAAAITVRIASAVAVRLGISGGILSSGAASTVATFGVGLAAGFVVDGAVDWIMKRAGYDPAGQIAVQTSAALVRIEELLIEGESGQLGLRHEINRLREVRKELRDAALKSHSEGGTADHSPGREGRSARQPGGSDHGTLRRARGDLDRGPAQGHANGSAIRGRSGGHVSQAQRDC